MIPRELVALVYILAALLIVVVIAGLWQGALDATGVAVALIGLLAGLVGGGVLRTKKLDE